MELMLLTKNLLFPRNGIKISSLTKKDVVFFVLLKAIQFIFFVQRTALLLLLLSGLVENRKAEKIQKF